MFAFALAGPLRNHHSDAPTVELPNCKHEPAALPCVAVLVTVNLLELAATCASHFSLLAAPVSTRLAFLDSDEPKSAALELLREVECSLEG